MVVAFVDIEVWRNYKILLLVKFAKLVNWGLLMAEVETIQTVALFWWKPQMSRTSCREKFTEPGYLSWSGFDSIRWMKYGREVVVIPLVML